MNKKPIAERLIDLADVQPPQEIETLFGQYIVKGAMHWVTGPTGSGKSTIAYNIATALAEGGELWDIQCEKHNVLYVDMETGDNLRAIKIGRIYGDMPRSHERLYFAREPIELPSELDELVKLAQSFGISLIIFDTVRRCFQVKDENDNAEFYNRIAPTLDRLKREGIATLTIGHPCKNGVVGARGASAQEDAGDINLSLTMHKGNLSEADAIISLSITKHRLLGFGVPPLYLRRIGDDKFERVNDVIATGKPAELGKQAQCESDIVDWLTDGDAPASYSEILHALIASGHAESTIKRALKALEPAGKIIKDATGRYTLPD